MTPPDTPKPPAEWTCPTCGHPRCEGTHFTNESRPPSKPTPLPPILAPSPQESHKLAEELERRCQELAQAHPHHVNGPIHNIAALVMTHRDAILAAMRSSPSEQDARELPDDLKMIEDTLAASGKESPFKPLWHASWRRIKVVVRAAIAASGGAKGDGNG